MNNKLTLKLNSSIINKAKIYSKNKHISLSKLVENFFSTLEIKSENKINQNNELSPIVKELSGIFNGEYDYNLKELKKDRLVKKYL